MEFEPLSGRIIGCAVEVHRQLGPGLLESIYRSCLVHELTTAGISCECEKAVSVHYKSVELACGFRMDVLVENAIVVELKAVNTLSVVHESQLLKYMKLAKLKIGLLMNFNSTVLRRGIKRFVL